MRQSKVITISVPPRLYQQAMKIAKARGMMRSELFREALRRYEAETREWQALLAYGRGKAKAEALQTEDAVERLIDASRR